MTCSLVTLRVSRPMWMREGRGVGDFSRLRRVEFERDRELRSRERRTLSLDFERRSDDPRRFPSRSELKRARDFGRSLLSFSFESTFLPALRLFERD